MIEINAMAKIASEGIDKRSPFRCSLLASFTAEVREVGTDAHARVQTQQAAPLQRCDVYIAREAGWYTDEGVHRTPLQLQSRVGTQSD